MAIGMARAGDVGTSDLVLGNLWRCYRGVEGETFLGWYGHESA